MKTKIVRIIVVAAIIASVVYIKLDSSKRRAEIKKSLTRIESELNEGVNAGKCLTNIVLLCKDENDRPTFWRTLSDAQFKNLDDAKRELLNSQLLLLILFDDKLKSRGVDARERGSKLIEFSQGLKDEDPYLWMSFFTTSPEYSPRVEHFIEGARTEIRRAIEKF